MDPKCIMCSIIQGSIPCQKLAETSLSLAFLDIRPLSKGHCLVIPKSHCKTFDKMSAQHAADLLPTALLTTKALIKTIGVSDYNILQNNGAIAHQEVGHVHFHIIPKPDESSGLQIGWPMQNPNMNELADLATKIRENMS